MKINRLAEPYYISRKNNEVAAELNNLIEYQLALVGDSSILKEERIGFSCKYSTANGDAIAKLVGKVSAEIQMPLIVNSGKGVVSVAANAALRDNGNVILVPYCGINKASISKSFWNGLGPEDMERLLCVSVYADDENWNVDRARRSDMCIAALSSIVISVEPTTDYEIRSYIDRAYQVENYLSLLIYLPDGCASTVSREIFSCENIHLAQNVNDMPDIINEIMLERSRNA